jgi:hypothetical protein
MNPHQAEKAFEKTFIYGKAFLVLGLLTMALVSAHKSYIAANPHYFVQDATLAGIFGGLSSWLLASNRGRPDLILSHVMFSVPFFFFFQVTRELSGFFALSEEKDLTKAESKIAPFFNYLTYAALVIVPLVLGYLAYKAKVPIPILKIPFWAETLILTIILTIPEVISAKHHDIGAMKTIAQSIVMFAGASVAFQYGGFYKELYQSLPPAFS